MGDHRPTITCTFEMHGHNAYYDFGYCNWTDNGDGIDQRIVDWFREQSKIAIMKWETEVSKAEQDRRKIELEKTERELFAKLKAKYE